jgi:hypothetical protein
VLFAGSRSLIIPLSNSRLIDEFEFYIHPVIEGRELSLFNQIKNRAVVKLTKSFDRVITEHYLLHWIT